MKNGRYVNVTEARKHLFEIIERANKEALPFTVTINGVPEAVIISKDDYDAWTATIETICDNHLIESIREGDKDIKSGRYSNWDDVKKKLGITLDVSNNTRKQGKKRTTKTG